jgi:uncharacterized protein (UPF0303 family)
MGFQKVEFEFPDEQEEKGLEIEDTSAVEIDLSGKKEADDYKEEVEAKEEVEIEVVDDTPKSDRKRKASEPPEDVTEEELENYSEKVRKRIQHFSKGYHDERRAKESAERERKELERYAKQLADENKELQAIKSKTQKALLEQTKKEAEKDVNVAKYAYKKAYDAGDAEKVLDAQEKLTDAKMKLGKLDDISLQEDETPVQSQQEAAQPDERASNWAKENTWFGSDEEMTAYAMGVHNKAVKEGLDPSSDEYYERINSRMRSTFTDYFGEEGQTEQETKKRKSNVVAPASRSTSPKKVTLTRTQVAIAKKLGVPLELYAKKVAEEMRNR